MSVHEHDGNDEWDEETRLLVWENGECAEPGDEGEHGERVDVADARLGPPLVGNHLEKEVAGGEKRQDG